MKLGFVSSIFDNQNFSEVIDIASSMDFGCVELASWPNEKAARRYAGVSHLDAESLSDEKAKRITALCKEKHISISSLAYYPNTLDADEKQREKVIAHLKAVILASEKIGINLVTSFIGRNQNLNIEDNISLFKEVWPPIIKFAEEHKTKIAIENCPMLFGPDQWPGGQNLFNSPVIWRKLFSIVDSPWFGLNFDPSHFVWQQMDYIKPIYEFKDKLFHIHFKDIKIKQEALDECGILAYPLDYMVPKLPGLGDIHWGKFISALTDVGYDGPVCIEMEDRSFENGQESKLHGLKLAKNYISQFLGI